MPTKRVLTKPHAASLDPFLLETFESFYLEKEAGGLAPKTLKNYRQSFEFFTKFCGFTEETVVPEVEQTMIFKWINTMKLEGVKPTSINHYLRDLRAFLYWCMEMEYLEPFKIKTIEAQEEQVKLFEDWEIEALLEKPRPRDGFVEWRTWAIVNWVLATGNRAATICDVRLTDVSYAKKEIVLRHTKNKKAQIIPLSNSLEMAIKEYCRMWRKDAPVDGFLFPNIGEEQLTTNALRLSFGRYCKSRGVEKSNIHGLRHNFAKGWVRNNGNMFVLQKILGHSSLAMTRRYVKMFSEDLKEDYDMYSPLDTIKKSKRRTAAVKRS